MSKGEHLEIIGGCTHVIHGEACPVCASAPQPNPGEPEAKGRQVMLLKKPRTTDCIHGLVPTFNCAICDATSEQPAPAATDRQLEESSMTLDELLASKPTNSSSTITMHVKDFHKIISLVSEQSAALGRAREALKKTLTCGLDSSVRQLVIEALKEPSR